MLKELLLDGFYKTVWFKDKKIAFREKFLNGMATTHKTEQ